jgi:hypothetical protein
MEKRFPLLLILLIGSGVMWFLWQPHRQAPDPTPSLAPSTKSDVQTDKSPPGRGAVSVQSASPPPIGVKPPDAYSERRYLEALNTIFLRSLVFHGKVVDERGAPVADAKVSYSLMSNPDPNGSNTRGTTISGQDGRFVITSRGAGIQVDVSKDGYYRVPRSNGVRGSSGGFRNYENLGDTDVPMPTEDKPAIFVLHGAGEAVALVHVGQHSISVPKDGTPTEIDLGTGQVVAAGKGQLRVEVWTQNQGMNPNKGEHYDWRCRLTIPGGGVVERKGQFDFEAPESGYRPSFETGMAKTAEGWSDGFERQFFVRLADGRFARLSLEVLTGGDHFIALESFLNPTPGNRNLEFDPTKAITPKP